MKMKIRGKLIISNNKKLHASEMTRNKIIINFKIEKKQKFAFGFSMSSIALKFLNKTFEIIISDNI